MKKLFTLVVFLICSNAAQSAEYNCNTAFSAAEMIMKNRQKGYSIVDQYEILDDMKSRVVGQKGYDYFFKIYEDMILMAYELPRYSSEDNKKDSIKSFANNWFLICKRLEIK